MLEQETCKKCGSAMNKRKHTKTDAVFWVCTRWPICKRSGRPFINPKTGVRWVSYDERIDKGIRTIQI